MSLTGAYTHPDPSSCEKEPIHIPGSIQPHGVLIALDAANLRVTHVSANLDEVLGAVPRQVLGRELAELEFLPVSLADRLRSDAIGPQPAFLQLIRSGSGAFNAVAHRRDDLLILELERTQEERELSFPELQQLVWNFLVHLQDTGPVSELTRLAAAEVRRITGFDRVLIYQFDESWNGTVVAEDRNDRLPSYLDLRFPSSDIPAQARELYRLNRIRLIADASYVPAPLFSHDPAPLDLTWSVLRSVSPVHIEYMKNMGTLASMSISIIRDGELWGLISCHHATPRQPGFQLRTACDLVGQIFSLQLSSREHAARYEARIRRKELHTRLLAAMAGEDSFTAGLARSPADLLAVADATGAAVLFGDQCTLLGRTPSEKDVRGLAEWLMMQDQHEFWCTTQLPQHWPAAEAFQDSATGVMSIAVSQLHSSYVFWFRPELVQTVTWGGDPRKQAGMEPADGGKAVRLSPRKSFEQWKEIVRGFSAAWTESDVEAAQDLRASIVSIVLRKAEELAEVSQELERSNKELEAFSYSVSHDLRAPFRHIVGYAELLKEMEGDRLSQTGARYISTIVESAHYAGTLVDNLLMFSQIARTSLTRVPVDMNVVVRETLRRMQPELEGRKILWDIADLPPLAGDPGLIRLVMYNLISNAVKYTRPRDVAAIEIGACASPDGRERLFFVRDNGVGFDMAYIDKLFGVFQRLHRMEDFEGTGIGLANVRRIISRHGGRTWAEGKPGEGATFWFAVPVSPASSAPGLPLRPPSEASR